MFKQLTKVIKGQYSHYPRCVIRKVRWDSPISPRNHVQNPKLFHGVNLGINGPPATVGDFKKPETLYTPQSTTSNTGTLANKRSVSDQNLADHRQDSTEETHPISMFHAVPTLKGTVSQKLRWILLYKYVNRKLCLWLLIIHYKILIFLKEHYIIYNKKTVAA